MMLQLRWLTLAIVGAGVSLAWVYSLGGQSSGDGYTLHEFERIQLTDVYYSEGANCGDLDRDGHMDIVHGPYWFRGPGWREAHEIYPAQAQNREAYADSFFSWVYDFDADGWPDVLFVGFPGTAAYVFRNPGPVGWQQPWPRHQVFDWVSNESPHFTQLVGDARPELVCTRDGYFGYATFDPANPWQPWQFHKISERIAPERFGHGLGVGDVNGDGRLDVLMKDGWFEQPASLDGEPLWNLHRFVFAEAGGAEMYAYDVDGDGDNDVITSLAAHEFGLAWYEQTAENSKISFRRHLIMGQRPEENRYGVVFSELHSVALADLDGDGLKDIVTGKTFWSHHRQSPMWDAGAVVYWFRLVRSPNGVDWVPYLIDDQSGIGRQITVVDVTGDGLLDVVVGGMKGAHVLVHRRRTVDEATYRAVQPKPRPAMAAGLTPQQAATHMTLPEGFFVDVFAAEPDVHQPVALAIDERGRVWVAEAYTYPVRAPEGQGRDRIVILEDSDGNGRADRRKVFAEGLNLVSGLEVGFGGVWVGAAPYLLFFADRDHDDHPDGPPEVLLDGFGYQDTHETLNAFIWGPDGWLYGCHGVFTHSRVGKPGTPDEQRVPMNAAIWRYHPLRHEFEVFAWGTSNPWGVDFNDHGQAFCTACVIPHLYHIIQGARYQRQAGQHFDPYVYDDIKTIADHLHYEGNIAEHAWWGHEPELPAATARAGGGHAHCGAMIYLGDNWPESYRNQLFVNNIHGNRVNNDLLERRGSGYVGHHGPDFLLANDRWFRGINLRYGPDGTVYLIDWYDRNACHRINPEIWDRTNGRIYRIRYGTPNRVNVNLHDSDESQLISLQTHRNDWFVRTARRLLQERGISDAGYDALVNLALNGPDTPARLRGLWAAHVTRGLNDKLTLQFLNDRDEYMRAWAIQLACEDRHVSAEVLSVMERLAATDPSPVVRLYLASAMQRLPLEQRWTTLARLMQHASDNEDHNIPYLIWYATEPLVAARPGEAIDLASQGKLEKVSRWMLRRAAADNAALDLVVQKLSKATAAGEQRRILEEMLRAFEGRVDLPMPPSWEGAYERAMRSEDPQVRDLAEQAAVIFGDRRIFPRLRSALTDPQAPLDVRRRALAILVRGRDTEAADALHAALRLAELRRDVLRALTNLGNDATPDAILGVYSQLTTEEKADAVTALSGRPAYAQRLLDAVQAGIIPRTDVHAYHVRQMLQLNHQELAARIRTVWGEVRQSSQEKQQRIAHYKSLLTPSFLRNAQLGNGRRLFDTNCASCHTLFGEGGKVGPDITGSNRADLDYILENLVDPSAVLGKDYRMTVITTTDGRVLSGIVQAESDTAITLRTLNDTVVIANSEIESRQLSELSLMPERLLDQMSPEEVRDLVAYLASPVQVPPRGPSAPIDPATQRVPGAQEGEQIRVLRKSAGNVGPQDMKPFTKDRWSGNAQLWWTGAQPGATLELVLGVEQEGTYALEVVMTRARDYGIVQLYLDKEKLGGPIDLYNFPDVVTTGVFTFPARTVAPGEHRLTVEIVGRHPQAVPAYMFGLDYVRWVPVENADAGRTDGAGTTPHR